MIRDVEPLRSLLKGAELYGLNLKHASHPYRKSFALIFTITISYWILVFLSVLQAESFEGFADRLNYLPSILGSILKAINMFLKYDELKKLLSKFDENFRDQKTLEKAAGKASILIKVQFSLMFIILLAGSTSTIFTQKLTVPMFLFNVPAWNLTWFYKILQIIGSFVGVPLLLIVNLIPISLMMIIGKFVQLLSQQFEALRASDGKLMKMNFIKYIKLHRAQKK